MAKSITAPYIVLEEFNQFLVPSWKKPEDGNDPFDGAYLDSFTPTTRKELAVTFEVKVSMIWDVLRIARESELALSASILCPATRRIITSPNIALKSTDKDGARSTALVIPEGALSNQAFFDCRLVLANDTKPTDSLAARFKSSLLWKHSTKVLLEGSSPMFPVTAERFSADNGGATAAWRMSWQRATLLSSPSKVRLITNSDNTHFINLLKTQSPDGLNPAHSMLQYNVACSMLENICGKFADDFRQIPADQLTEGTLGHNLNMFFKKFFHPRYASITDLIEAYKDNPEQCRAVLQSKIEGNLLHV
jgi:hypothetical protein